MTSWDVGVEATGSSTTEAHFDELARIVTTEHGKTLDEARGSVRRGIECVEVACGAPSLMQGLGLEDIAAGIDCHVVRQPLGVVAAIAPFNFPAMVPMWFLPFAIVTGNTFDHPGIRAVSFVGSTSVAKHVYQRATYSGKRAQALGGAKNFVVVMPDADLERSIGVITESFYGCAGERCLAGSMLVPIGEAHRETRDRMVAAAKALLGKA